MDTINRFHLDSIENAQEKKQSKIKVAAKSIIFAFALIMTSINLLGQTENATYKAVADNFEANYNKGDYDAIFNCFSTEMKNALPLEQAKIFFSQQKFQSGNISGREFLKYQQSAAIYKTKFERGVFTLLVSIDNDSKINGFYINPFVEDNLPKPERNKTKLILPLKDGEWAVVWGGDTKEQNYHVEHRAQKNAFDFIITDEKGKSFKTNGKTNDDYYAFGKELIAPCDGEVVLVVDGVKDNVPGTLNPIYVPGNTVIVKTENNEYLFFAHFKQHSVKVKEGQKIKQGEILGLCGNSGNSTEAHLHFHIQNTEDMNIATGIKCYFDKLAVNGQPVNDYSPLKGEKIKPLR
ncbi:MAG: peptidoglycan DD-metalloendopeptidase family protein [Prevotellaceae bacterium]|jgi:murein DD-endopeptidase MepM/ murein hydrolase activator NlpD|nr:peptidoglycan DD-metalloendopeptidase family protein [Prevotellaceae bacterium]